MIVPGDADTYTTRTIEFLMTYFHQPLTARWLSALFADKLILACE